jgi:hypothetical protein
MKFGLTGWSAAEPSTEDELEPRLRFADPATHRSRGRNHESASCVKS